METVMHNNMFMRVMLPGKMSTTSAVDLSWQQGDLAVFLPVMLATVFFTLFWFISRSTRIKNWFQNRYDPDRASVNYITFNRIIGFLAMGVIPGIIVLIALPGYHFSALGLGYNPETTVYSLAWMMGLSAIVIPLALLSAKNPKNLVNYPQIRARIWNRRIVLINILGWSLYLFGYEFLFRGVLLFPLAEQAGVWPAIAVNMALYSATHIPKGFEETIGALPLGLVLCMVTLGTGTIWIAFMVHLAMALTNSFASLKSHPEMHYKRD